MRSIWSGILFVSMMTAGTAFADFLPNEVNLCSNGGCTQKMTEIQNAFASGTEFNPLLAGPTAAYSGSCYYMMSSIDPNHENHGGFVLWRDEDDVMHFNGVFHFFAKSDPYEGMTGGEMFKLIRSKSTTPHPVREETTMGHVIIASETANLHYWMRTNSDGSEMYLLSQWIFKAGPSNSSFCRLKRH
ncbi:MAG TPA: hypothetical protein PL182_06365 [Pseudobdellovibrionaceae bacterium]|nr:hypothetical protein [Pseudobdellovibrionaceae bacterium]